MRVLLKHKANLAFAEPFGGNTPLHAFAKEGHAEAVGRLLQTNAPANALNEEGRTPRQEAEHALQQLEMQRGEMLMLRREGLEFTVAIFEAYS